MTNVHGPHPWCYLYLVPLSISLIIPMVQLWSSGSPTYRPPVAALQLKLPPCPYSGVALDGGPHKGKNVHCRCPWRYIRRFPFSYFLINPMEQVRRSGPPTYRPPDAGLQLKIPPGPAFRWPWGGSPQRKKCTLSLPLALHPTSPFLFFFVNPHGSITRERITDL